MKSILTVVGLFILGAFLWNPPLKSLLPASDTRDSIPGFVIVDASSWNPPGDKVYAKGMYRDTAVSYELVYGWKGDGFHFRKYFYDEDTLKSVIIEMPEDVIKCFWEYHY